MVIELSGVQFGLNHTRDFKIEQACRASSIWNRMYDFGPKLHDRRFNYHFITSILEIAQIQDLVSSNTLLMQYWANFKLNSSILGGGGEQEFWKQKLQTKLRDPRS